MKTNEIKDSILNILQHVEITTSRNLNDVIDDIDDVVEAIYLIFERYAQQHQPKQEVSDWDEVLNKFTEYLRNHTNLDWKDGQEIILLTWLKDNYSLPQTKEKDCSFKKSCSQLDLESKKQFCGCYNDLAMLQDEIDALKSNLYSKED